MKRLITLTIMGCIIYAGSCLTVGDYKSICNPEKADWNDDFTTFNPRWDWNYNEGTGYKRLTTIDNVSVVEIGITNQSSSSSYSDCSLHEKSYQYNNGVFEARLRYTGDHEFGTMGWGFWNYQNPESFEAAWFFAASPESGASLSNFQAMVVIDSAIVYQKFLPEIDIEKWHIYRVEFSSDGIRFFVDGQEVASTSKCLSKQQRFELWIDNYHAQVVGDKIVPVGYLNIQQDQRMYIDWVMYYGVGVALPEITFYGPESPVSDYECATRTFNITINQTVNVSWRINGTVVLTDKNVTESSYTNTSAVIGTWNVSVVVNNANGTDMQTWVWTVEPSPCFIATAAYGTPLHEDITVLRDFRDQYLMTNAIGRAFVKIYYTASPSIAAVIRENEGLMALVRAGLVKPLVYILNLFFYLSIFHSFFTKK